MNIVQKANYFIKTYGLDTSLTQDQLIAVMQIIYEANQFGYEHGFEDGVREVARHGAEGWTI